MRPASQPPLDDNAVAEFLANNGDFLIRRPELLPDVAVGDNAGSGGVVSLTDRQVVALRTRNHDLRKRLAELIETARDNDLTFSRLRELTLALMDATNPAGLDRLMARHLLDGFRADHTVCFMPRVLDGSLEHFSARVVKAPWDRLFDYPEPTCGAYRAEEYALLFPSAMLSGPGSAAVIPMRRASATLAIGSKNPRRFSPDMGKMFLSFLGGVLERTLMRLRL